jgi:RND family efflux transporter MFP subunit
METSSALFELASVSLACRDQDTLLKTFAARVGTTLGARAVLIWIANASGEELVCRMRWAEPGERLHPTELPVSEGPLTMLYRSAATRRLPAREIAKEDLEHLDEFSRTRVKSALYASLPGAQRPGGVVEVLNKHVGDFTAEDAHFLEEACQLAGRALTNLDAIEAERHAQLSTLERLTALYDLGRTFTSTLELEELLPIVAGKIRDILGAGACNLWLASADGEQLTLAKQIGEDPTVEEDATVPLNEGLLADIAQQANPKLLEDPGEEPALAERIEKGGDFEIHSWMGAPLRKDDEVLGVVEIINKSDGTLFNEDDLFFLSSISEQAAVALHNANLLESERKVHALDALLKISQEITSTLDLDHVLTTVVAQSSNVVPFESCVIGFYDRGRFILGAVSGETEVPKTREMSDLRERMEWVAEQENPVSANLHEDGWQVEPDETKAQAVSFLEEHGHQGFYGLPLRDDQGTLGAMILLSNEPDFLSESNLETLAILASQTTVAIRNAQLYQQVPLASIFQPFAQRKKKLIAAMPRSRVVEYAQRAGIVAALLPADRRVVSSMEGGTVKQVFVREGDLVKPGQVLAQLDDSEDRVKLAEAEAALSQARRELAEAEFRNDPSAAGQAQIRNELYFAEVALEQQRVNEARLTSPIAGIAVTPKVEDKTGTMLKAGDPFTEIVAQDHMAAEMSVPETDLALVRPGEPMALKLNAFPTITFKGNVERLGAQTHTDSGDQYFLVRAIFENTGGNARDGMVGRARIQSHGGWFGSGWYPIGYAILRSPFRWIWQKAWAFLP